MTEHDRAGGRVLLVEPTPACAGILRRARELGIETVVVSYDHGDRCLPDELRALTDMLVVADANDENALTATVLELHRERPFTGLIPGFEFYVEVVARLAARLGLPGLPVAAVRGLRDKAQMRERAAAAGLRVPRLAAVTSSADLDAAADRVGYPLVLKPLDSAGSVHVSRADDAVQLRRAYDWMLADDRTDLGRRLDGRAVVEQYIEGQELTVEGYVDGGQVVIVSVTDKFLGPEPTFVETGHIVEADLPRVIRDRVESFTTALVRALDVTLGPFHCELRLADEEPVLLEIGARLPGGHIVDLIELATGVSLPHIMLAAYTGQDPAVVAPQAAPRAKFAGIAMFIAPEVEEVARITGFERVANAPSVLAAELYVEPGDPVPPLEDFRARLGHVIYRADSFAEAVSQFREFTASVRIEG